jgi:hypothetical protein
MMGTGPFIKIRESPEQICELHCLLGWLNLPWSDIMLESGIHSSLDILWQPQNFSLVNKMGQTDHQIKGPWLKGETLLKKI